MAETSQPPKIGRAPETKPARLGRVLEFMQLLWTIDHALQSTSKCMAKRFGITGPQRVVIRVVGRLPGISAGELARILHVDPSTLTGVLKRLHARGILDRLADPADARRALFKLTKKGEGLSNEKNGTVEAAVRRVLDRLPPEQVEATQMLFQALGAELARSR